VSSAKKLVLFDIDGTLIRHFGKEPDINIGWWRFAHALNTVFGINVIPEPTDAYHGSVDRAILFDIASKHGVSKAQFDDAFDRVREEIIRYATTKETKQIYEVIPEAKKLVALLRTHPDRFAVGILTGNVDAMAKWKLTHVGINPSWFELFVTSDEFDDRISLAKSAFVKAETDANLVVKAEDTVVIGDAVGDVRCARAIGAMSIIVTTGKHDRIKLEAESPDIIVDSLSDTKVLQALDLL